MAIHNIRAYRITISKISIHKKKIEKQIKNKKKIYSYCYK